jgi:phosphatidylglycerol:prolipoprotein diacylglycerol transferase
MSLYGLIIGICLAVSAWYFSKNNHIIPKKKEDFFIIGTIISAIIGARSYHVIEQWNYYSQDITQIINTRGGGLAIYGGLIGGVIFVTLFAWIYKLSLISITDIIVPILPLVQAFGRLGNYINRENPVWWPEAILNLLLFAIIAKTKSKHSPTAVYLIGYGIIRGITETFRNDTWVWDGIKIAHIISVFFVISGILFIIYNNKTTNITKK